MIDPQALGALAGTHELLLQLVESLPPRDCCRRFDDQLPSAGWLLGRAVYLELHLFRGRVIGDDDLAARVRHLFGPPEMRHPQADSALPPHDHLLHWAGEVFDQHLTWLANPALLPERATAVDSRLVWTLAELQALLYEQLLAVMGARSAQRGHAEYRVGTVLRPRLPIEDAERIEQGHYRIGAREGFAMPCEMPAQVVELHAFRINHRPVSNAEFLAFIDDGAYQTRDWWDEDGEAWRRQAATGAPWHWRRDTSGHWYAIGVNGPADLPPDEPVSGISAHEARAFAAWAAANGANLAGAVPQHEYQWEVAARLNAIEQSGRVWEWCANAPQPYADYLPPDDPDLDLCLHAPGQVALRGGSIHTQPRLRRSTFRWCADPAHRAGFAGLRLVMPPGKAAWE